MSPGVGVRVVTKQGRTGRMLPTFRLGGTAVILPAFEPQAFLRGDR